jgi:hypothetical protein
MARGEDVCEYCGHAFAFHKMDDRGKSPFFFCPDGQRRVTDAAFHPPSDPPATGQGHPGYLALLDEMRELHCRKAADYGAGADPFANVRASVEFGVENWVGVMIRANDKMRRIKSFIANGSLKNESIEDSLKDLAAYALIALVLRREEQEGGGK